MEYFIALLSLIQTKILFWWRMNFFTQSCYQQDCVCVYKQICPWKYISKHDFHFTVGHLQHPLCWYSRPAQYILNSSTQSALASWIFIRAAQHFNFKSGKRGDVLRLCCANKLPRDTSTRHSEHDKIYTRKNKSALLFINRSVQIIVWNGERQRTTLVVTERFHKSSASTSCSVNAVKYYRDWKRQRQIENSGGECCCVRDLLWRQ